MLLRRLTRYPLEKLYRQDLRPQDDQFLLWLMEWYQYTTDSRLRSLDLLKQLIEMGDRKKRQNVFEPMPFGFPDKTMI